MKKGLRQLTSSAAIVMGRAMHLTVLYVHSATLICLTEQRRFPIPVIMPQGSFSNIFEMGIRWASNANRNQQA